MERLNGNQVLLASSKRNEEAVMKLVDLKQKEVWEAGQAHRKKILVLLNTQTHLTQKVLRYSW